MQFKRSYKRNDKMLMKGSLKLLAHLVNQQVVGSVIALQIAVILLENPTGKQIPCFLHWLLQVLS
jgi:pre-mRNA-splicing factor CWC22